ncbi:MAG: type II toxin-antitoxin system Phd/YefM family antitoxin [Chromatiales bacterium]|nr:type II toxin-antitoxin system Phd/YefM family antitoxin [Gammaproteobacteria bacterium]MBW6475577.1 type II toxin-antitoxin system Phd/YefM family antitoxin [Chromatiales bacterium]
MQTVQIGEMKAQLSKILDEIRDKGEEYVLEFGRAHEKVAVLIPYAKYRQLQQGSRKPGLLKDKASFVLREDFAISDEELLGR